MQTFVLNSSLFVGGFSNLKVQVTSNTQISITADSILLKSTDKALGANNVSLTNTITTSGVNGLDTGSEASNTWYSVWVISNGTTLASILSLSATAPTAPSYAYKVRVGWVRNNESSNLWRTLQFNQDVQVIVGTNPATINKMTPAIVTSNSSRAILAASVSDFVPPTASRIRGFVFAVNSRAGVAPNADYGDYGTTNAPPVSVYATGGAAIASSNSFDFILESSNIYWFSNDSDNYVVATGWRDNL